MPTARAPFVTYDSTLLDHVAVGAGSALASASIRTASVLFVTALTAAAAQLSLPLPFTTVPFTLQPMIVLVGAAALGARLGATSQALYLLLGLAGFHVFAASPILPQGPARLLGPTAGYLLAYPLAAYATGWLAERGFDRRYVTAVGAMAVGLSIVFAGGVAWLAWLMPAMAGRPGASGLSTAVATGLAPFILADLVKLALAGAVLPALWMLVGPARRA
ncbi:MAG: biotin transporter BioY [Vicinamibacterales bacterium]